MALVRARLPRVFRLHALQLRLLFACWAIIAVFVTLAIRQVDAQLHEAHAGASRTQAEAVSRTFHLARGALDRADLGTRLEQLRRQTPGAVRVDLFVNSSGGPVKVASTDNGTLADDAAPSDVAALADARVRFRELNQHGRHLLQTTFALREDGKAFASAALYFDLHGLDAATARAQRQTVIAGLGVGLLMALCITALLRLSLFRPLHRMRDVTRRLAGGELAARLRWRRVDELGALAADFDVMAEALQQSHARLEGLALTDPLTGLANHRAFHEALTTELQRAHREVYDVALVLLDVDQFKRVNDTWGHGVGDEALRLVAQSLRLHTRPGDIVGRLGGDEFGVALVRSNRVGALEVVERICAAVRRLGVGPARATLTLSAGIAEYPAHADDEPALLAHADAALYEAKRAGRNRTVVWREPGDAGTEPAQPVAAGPERAGLVSTVHALARAVDAKDAYTQRHSQRVAAYAVALGSAAGLEEDVLHRLQAAGVLHDVGKIGVPDAVLLKAGPLDAAELDDMRRHSELGADIVAGAGLADVALWVRHVHERWDGGGYPDGIGGAEIPLESRVLAIADAFEAMTSTRVYRTAMPPDEALAEIGRCAGSQFDPTLAHVFVELVQRGGIALAAAGR